MADSFDVIVIGSGPGGYTTAIRATQLGFKTAIVEREKLGGICLNWGCIPTKALLRTAEVYRNMQHAKEYGLAADNIRFDSKAVVERSRGVANKLSNGVSFLMKKNKITVLMGDARIEKAVGGNKVIVKGEKGEETYAAKHIIIATGARAREMPDLGMKADGKRLWTYRDAMTPPEWPQSLLVFGSGAIGIEFASFYQTLGVKVTVIELMDRILPVEDEEVSAFALKQFKKQGLEFRIGAKASNVKVTANGVSATIESGGKSETLEASHAIIAVGIVGNVENLGLEALGVKVDRTHITTDGLGKTNVPGIYAIGDITGPPWLAHKAGHEGTVCIEAIAGQHPHALDVNKIPGCTYSHPQVASIGLTEAKAKEQGRAVKVGKFPFQANGKAIALGEAEGFVKTIFDAKTGELLGAHMIGAEVTELIQGYAVAMTAEATESELIGTIFPHPTLSEMMHESVLDAYGRVINA
jgi:dihydrolipoamide dehydrogenase